MATQTNIGGFVGEDVSWNDTITGQNITGWALTATIRKTYGSPILATKTVGAGITITSGPAGTLTVTIAAADTATLKPGNYLWFIERTDAGQAAELSRGFLTLESRGAAF